MFFGVGEVFDQYLRSDEDSAVPISHSTVDAACGLTLAESGNGAEHQEARGEKYCHGFAGNHAFYRE